MMRPKTKTQTISKHPSENVCNIKYDCLNALTYIEEGKKIYEVSMYIFLQ